MYSRLLGTRPHGTLHGIARARPAGCDAPSDACGWRAESLWPGSRGTACLRRKKKHSRVAAAREQPTALGSLDTPRLCVNNMRGINETQEEEVGVTLRERTLVQRVTNNIGSLGPHDLCCVIKVGKKNSIFGRLSDVAGGGPIGTFHYVCGADLGSVAAVAAYFYDLVQRQETTTLWEGGMHRVVTGGTMSIWNAFQHVDLRVEFQVPGKTKVYVVDVNNGKTYPPTEDMWRECRVSSILRSMELFRRKTMVTATPVEMRESAFRTFNPVATREKMLNFLEDVMPLFGESARLGSVSNLLSPDELPAAGQLAVHIFLLMAGRGQHGDAVEFFGKLAVDHPLVVVYIAALCQEMGEVKRGMNILCASVAQPGRKSDPLYSPMLAAQMMLLLDDGAEQSIALGPAKRAAYTIDLGKRLVTMRPYSYSAWMLLARAHACAGDFPQALLALNTAPLRFSDHAVSILKKDPSKLALSGWVFDYAWAQGGMEGKWREQFSIDHFVSLNLAAYDLLVMIESKLGWNEFLALRNSVFLVAAGSDDESEGESEAEEAGEINVAEEQRTGATKLSIESSLQNEVSELAMPKESEQTTSVDDEVECNTAVAISGNSREGRSSSNEEATPNIDEGAGLKREEEMGATEDDVAKNDSDSSNTLRTIYVGPPPLTRFAGRPRPCQPALDALISALHKDLSQFNVWVTQQSEKDFHEGTIVTDGNTGNASDESGTDGSEDEQDGVKGDEGEVQHSGEDSGDDADESSNDEDGSSERSEDENDSNNSSDMADSSSDDASDSEEGDEDEERALTRGIRLDEVPRTKEGKEAHRMLRMGYLLCRLKYYDLAFSLLHKCVGLAYSLDAWLAIALLATHQPQLLKDDLNTALLSIVQIILSFDDSFDVSSLNDAHPFIRETLVHMIGTHGLAAVRQTTATITARFSQHAADGSIHLDTNKIRAVSKCLDNALRDAVSWRSRGYDK